MTLAMPISPTPTPAAPSPLLPFSFRLFTVEEYHKMLEVGVLREGEPVELLEGWLVEKMTRGSRHDGALNRLLRILISKLPAGWEIRAQSAVTLARSEPEPDLAIVRAEERGYDDRHPNANETAVVIEISASSLETDRGLKARVYAAAGIPQYWIVDVEDRSVEIRSAPSAGANGAEYAATRTYRAGDSIPLVIGGVESGAVAVNEVFPV